MNYTHKTVNHNIIYIYYSQCFVDPTTGAHTQTVERMWGGCKSMLRQQRTMHSQLFATYLPEFMWRKRFDGLGQNAFANIIKHITEQYSYTLLLYTFTFTYVRITLKISLAGSIMELLDLDWHIMAAGSQISLCYPTVTCCCGLLRDYSDCSVLSLSLFYVLLEAVHVIHTLCVVYAIPKDSAMS